MNAHAGGCHCGDLRYVLETELALEQLPLRACQCSFCRRHGALSTSDPKGRVRFEFKDERNLIRYRFGHKTADFLICARCGSYIGAMLTDGGQSWAIVNANTLDQAGQLTQPMVPMDYESETSGSRTERRKARWTPVVGG